MRFTRAQNAWFEALESDRFPQTHLHLATRANPEAPVAYDALGLFVTQVLGLTPQRWDEGEDGQFAIFRGLASAGDEFIDQLPPGAAERLGLFSPEGHFADGKPVPMALITGDPKNRLQATSLRLANDLGATFKEIARLCREHPKLVFQGFEDKPPAEARAAALPGQDQPAPPRRPDRP